MAVMYPPRAVGAERKTSLRFRLFAVEKLWPIGVAFDAGVFVVIQASASHLLVFHGKAQRFNQMEFATGVGGQANHIARVRWNFGLV